MSKSSIDSLTEIKGNVKIHTHYYVREDNISLYGFLTLEELRMFELLLSVSGIGAKSALTILSAIEPSSFALAVITDDVSRLVKIPGVGAKSAARIILELKDKLKSANTYSDEKVTESVLKDSGKIGEASSALQVLGYTKKEIEKVFEKLDLNSLGLEEIIKKSLNLLGK